MPRYIRSNTPGASYFFTVTLRHRKVRWLARNVDLLRECVATVKRRHPFEIDAMVVLPDHIHALWTLPDDDADFAMRWMLIKVRFGRLLRKQLDLPGHVDIWQRGYWEHQIRDDDDYARHVEYIHFNPVKHGHVERAVDWPHSSFHRWVKDGRVAADWGIAASVEGAYGE